MKKKSLIAAFLLILVLVTSITVVSAASLNSLGVESCPISPPNDGCGCKSVNKISGLYCKYQPGLNWVVGNYTSNCTLIDYWDCPGSKCHCAALGTPDHCCADWGDCRQHSGKINMNEKARWYYCAIWHRNVNEKSNYLYHYPSNSLFLQS